jgi:chemotaxis protein MotB
MALSRRNSTNGFDIWPGFVDALATLLMVIIFLLMIFIVAQFFLTDAISGRDQALERLNRQVDELADLLALERKVGADLRNNVAQLSTELKSTISARDTIETKLSDLRGQNATLSGELEETKGTLNIADQEKARLTSKIVQLRGDIDAITNLRNELAKDLVTAQTKIKKQADDAQAAKLLISKERKFSEAAKAQLALLNRQMRELRIQITTLNTALNASEQESKEQKAQIFDLGKRLNSALASKVQELTRYRSEFFGRLRNILGNRQGISVVGDRFVLQSEVLFESGSAKIGEGGKLQLTQLSLALRDIVQNIPKDISWVLRVDGHTDAIPIKTADFPSNWELSTARAISVVKYLISTGIPARNLAAAGFGEFLPIDARRDEVAYRRNRRIELKLDRR